MLKSTTYLLILVIIFLSSCGGKQTKVITTEAMTASGEFLFEGPNTLQGNFSLDLELLADELDIKPSEIKEVNIERILLDFDNPNQYPSVESVLVQLVSNDLSLISAGTLTTPDSRDNILSVNTELDIKPYIEDTSSQLIVDANLSEDMDELSVSVVFLLLVEY